MVASVDRDDFVSPMVFVDHNLDPHSLVITMGLARHRPTSRRTYAPS